MAKEKCDECGKEALLIGYGNLPAWICIKCFGDHLAKWGKTLKMLKKVQGS